MNLWQDFFLAFGKKKTKKQRTKTKSSNISSQPHVPQLKAGKIGL